MSLLDANMVGHCTEMARLFCSLSSVDALSNDGLPIDHYRNADSGGQHMLPNTSSAHFVDHVEMLAFG